MNTKVKPEEMIGKGKGGGLDYRGDNGDDSGREKIGGSEWIKGRDD